jgi:hypothetical protein
VEEPDRLGRLELAGELDERESARATGLPVSGQVDLDDAAGLGQELRQNILGGAEIQVPNEDAGWNGLSPPLVDRTC